MCKGCKHDSGCTDQKVADFLSEPCPLYEPENFSSKLDALRSDLPELPSIALFYLGTPVTEPAVH